MAHGKDTAYVEERLRAIDRDITFKFGVLATQLKRDFTDIRERLNQHEQRLQALERRVAALDDPVARPATQVN